jgi:hypothetical protein
MRNRTIALIGSLAVVSVTASACIGRMAVTREVSKFNLSVTDEKWGRELTFFVLHVIPVYPLAYMADIWIVNSLEFWTGENPVSGEDRLARAGERRIERGADGSLAAATVREDGSLDLELYASDGSAHVVNLARARCGDVVASSPDGRELGRMHPDGSIVVR